MDIAKYVLTAVIITSAFEELADVGWMMYLWGVLGALIINCKRKFAYLLFSKPLLARGMVDIPAVKPEGR